MDRCVHRDSGGFFFWIHRACKNLNYLEVIGTSFTPGWAIGCWFIPIANFFIPYQLTKELWKTSDTNTVSIHSIIDQNTWKQAYTSPILILWWLLWLASGFLDGWIYAQLDNTDMADISAPANIDIFTATLERELSE